MRRLVRLAPRLMRWVPVGTRREQRRRAALRARLRGQYGPRWWEVAPLFVLVALLVVVPAYALGWLWSRVAWWAALLGLGALGWAGRAVVLRRRRVQARRRQTARRFTIADVDAADDRAYRRIVGRLLIRDGWQRVRGVRVNDWGAVHLVGEGPDGQQLGVAFERGVPATDGDGPRGVAALRPVIAASDTADAPGRVAPLLLVVSAGGFTRERVVWAARTRVRLVDRSLLSRWAAGENLASLLDLDR
jgi:hypothetical protein